MKKGVYIIYQKITDKTGVHKKIQGQIDAFKNAGFDMKILHMEALHIQGWKFLYRLPFTNVLPHWKWFDEFGDCDFIYFRHPTFMNIPFLKLMKEIKRRNPKVKIIMEIPTYPYDREMLLFKKNLPLFIKDKIIRGKVKRYVDRIAILTLDEYVFGTPTLKIKNGFDFARMRPRTVKQTRETIDIVMAAMFEKWHGYERMIEGLSEYYSQEGERKIHLHFVGDGTELNNYKKLVADGGLDAYVTFYGKRSVKEIQKIYDQCDLGVSTLGGYKKDYNYDYSLKSREYLAVGLPVIGAGSMDIEEYSELQEYILTFSNDGSSISYERIIQFYDTLYKDKNREQIEEMVMKMRNDAEKNLNMSKAMEKVIRYIDR